MTTSCPTCTQALLVGTDCLLYKHTSVTTSNKPQLHNPLPSPSVPTTRPLLYLHFYLLFPFFLRLRISPPIFRLGPYLLAQHLLLSAEQFREASQVRKPSTPVCGRDADQRPPFSREQALVSVPCSVAYFAGKGRAGRGDTLQPIVNVVEMRLIFVRW